MSGALERGVCAARCCANNRIAMVRIGHRILPNVRGAYLDAPRTDARAAACARLVIPVNIAQHSSTYACTDGMTNDEKMGLVKGTESFGNCVNNLIEDL